MCVFKLFTLCCALVCIMAKSSTSPSQQRGGKKHGSTSGALKKEKKTRDKEKKTLARTRTRSKRSPRNQLQCKMMHWRKRNRTPRVDLRQKTWRRAARTPRVNLRQRMWRRATRTPRVNLRQRRWRRATRAPRVNLRQMRWRRATQTPRVNLQRRIGIKGIIWRHWMASWSTKMRLNQNARGKKQRSEISLVSWMECQPHLTKKEQKQKKNHWLQAAAHHSMMHMQLHHRLRPPWNCRGMRRHLIKGLRIPTTTTCLGGADLWYRDRRGNFNG